MAQLLTLTILGACIAAGVVLVVAMLVIALLGPPATRTPIGRFAGALTAAMLVSSMALVVFPGMLDPLCDDFDWFGARTAKTARRYAYVMKAPIGRLEQR